LTNDAERRRSSGCVADARGDAASHPLGTRGGKDTVRSTIGLYRKTVWVFAGSFFSEQAGENDQLPELLEPLASHRQDFTVFSHLDHKLTGGHFATVGLIRPVLSWRALV